MSSNRTPSEDKIHLVKEVHLVVASELDLMAFKINLNRARDDKDKEDKTPSEIYSTSSKKCLVEKVKAKEVPRINKLKVKT
jgi:hypothetical protein